MRDVRSPSCPTMRRKQWLSHRVSTLPQGRAGNPTFRVCTLTTGPGPAETAGIHLDRDHYDGKLEFKEAGEKLKKFSQKFGIFWEILKRSFVPLG